MKLYHCAKTRSTRVLWLLEELGLDYDLEVMPFDPKALQQPDYLSLNPFGKVPALVDGPVSMFESIAIMQYILEHYANGRLEPDRKGPDYGVFLQWLVFGEATLMGQIAVIGQHTFLLPEGERNPAEVERARKTLATYAEILDEELSGKSYLAAETFTAADISVGYALFLLHMFDVYPAGNANLDAYYERLAARRAFQTATSL